MKIGLLYIFVVATLFDSIVNSKENSLLNDPYNIENIPEDGRLNFTDLAEKYGHPAEEFQVITEDGYILKLFHVPGNKSQPVLLTHGLLDSADTFIIRGNGSLAIHLADAGYDVWVSNHRGNKYSRRHITLNPDKDKKFWDYSVHEIGYYDMPANIDFVLNQTGQRQLQAIGHSEGTNVYYVLTATRPEYNDKIKVFVSLAPICYTENIRPPVGYLIDIGPQINELAIATGIEEVLGNYSQVKVLENLLCSSVLAGYPLCSVGIYQYVCGYDSDEIGPNFFPVVVGHFPAGTSRKNLIHYTQIGLSKTFAQYDYGLVKNLAVYGSPHPPKYNLSNITMRTVLLVANNDKLSTKEDVAKFRKQLRNGTVVEHRVLPRKQMNHMDFIWGKHMYKYLFPYIFDALEKYN